MRVAALMMVRDEADIVALNVRFHRSMGVTDFFVVDNGSTDSTPKILAELSKEIPTLRWSRDDGPYAQGDITTALAKEAHASGAEWVVPIDADEFWVADGGFQRALSDSDCAALSVYLDTFVQQRDVVTLREDNLLTMTYRVSRPSPYGEESRRKILSGEIGCVEIEFPRKWISRAGSDLSIGLGNHGIAGVEGTREETTAVRCFHAVLRARGALDQKADQGRRWREWGANADTGWRAQRWADLDAAGKLHDDWAANSWKTSLMGRRAYLNPPGRKSPVTFDTRLRDLVSPFV